MRTENGIDLEALCSAVEHRDASSQVGFYAEDAEVRLTSLRETASAARTLTGRSQIEDWIGNRCAERDATRCTAVYQWIATDQVMVTEESRRQDGSTTFTASVAHISSGLISSQYVVLIHSSPSESP